MPLGVHLAMKMLVDHSEPGPESEREDKIKAEQGGLAGTPLNNASASVYEGEQREEKSSAPSIKHRVHYTEAGAGLLH